MTLRLGSHTFSMSMYVVRDYRQDVLLGWDFFKTHAASIDAVCGTFMFNNEKISLLSSLRALPLCCNVFRLAQQQQGVANVVAYASHVLSATECNWSTFDRGWWAIVWSVRHFLHYLQGCPFIIVTDYQPLLGLKKMPIDRDPTGRRARWALELDVYNWVIQHRNGIKHTNADSLPRRPSQTDAASQPTSNPSLVRRTKTSIIAAPLTVHATIDLSGILSMDIKQMISHSGQ